MGAGGRLPVPRLRAGRGPQAPVHRGASIGLMDAADVEALGITIFTAYSYEAVHTSCATARRSARRATPRSWGSVIGHIDPADGRARAPRLPVVLQQAFTRRAMERWETELVGPLVDRIIDEFVDDGRADLVRQLLFPFPVAVIAALLGLPDEDLPRFHRLAVELIGVSVNWDGPGRARPSCGSTSAASSSSAGPSPRDDMISVLATAEHDGHRLDRRGDLRLLPPAAPGGRRDDLPVLVEPARSACSPTRTSSTPSGTTARSCRRRSRRASAGSRRC